MDDETTYLWIIGYSSMKNVNREAERTRYTTQFLLNLAGQLSCWAKYQHRHRTTTSEAPITRSISLLFDPFCDTGETRKSKR